MTDWANWSLCEVSCETGTESRERICEFENRNHVANADDAGCADGYNHGKNDGYFEERNCNTQPCRE